MNVPDTTMKIQTLGTFKIFANGKQVALDWPNETLKVLFCSLLSPLDLYITWDRICHSTWGVPATQTHRKRLDEVYFCSLANYLEKEMGFNPLIPTVDGIRIDQHRVHVDASEFYRTTIEGLNMMSLGKHIPALKIFKKANTLYTGSFLPGLKGKIISNARNDLESLYRTVVVGTKPLKKFVNTTNAFRNSEPRCNSGQAEMKYL